MAPEKMINQKGQALIDSLAVLALAGLLILLLIRHGLRSIHEVALSEIMENRLICELEDTTHCEINMMTELKKIQFKTESAILNKTDSVIQLKLSGQLFEQFNLERALEKTSFNEKF